MEQNKIFTKEQYQAIKAAWGQRKNHDATDHIIYNAMRGLPLDRGFTPISDTNFDKIRSNEEDRWNGFNNARRYAAGRFKGENDAKLLETWGVLPTPELLEILKNIPRHG
jgi:hypothetical protein